MHHFGASGRKGAVNGVGAWLSGYVNLTAAQAAGAAKAAAAARNSSD